MPLLTLVVEQYVQWRFGGVAAIGFLLVTIGLKAENATCASIGGILVVLPAIPAGA
jgi:hypothetical protein